MSENEKFVSKEEKLDKDEFRLLIPHLEYNQLFLIEIQCSGKWKYLFDTHYENKKLSKLTCTACSENLNLDGFQKHIFSSDHLSALEKVDKFYHPLFTSEQKSSLTENSDTLLDITKRDMQKAKAIAAEIEFLRRLQSSKRRSYFAEVSLSLEDIMTVEFQRKAGNKLRQPLVTTKGKARTNSNFKCVLCSKVCNGVLPLSDHLRGASHRSLQLKIHEVYVPKFEHLTKYCIFSYNPEENYSFKFLKSKEESDKKNEQENAQIKKEDDKKAFTSNFKKGVDEGKKELKKDFKNGLIGVEYVAQLEMESQPGSYLYACCLCDTEIMTSAYIMEKHLISLEHRLKYCELYYLDTIENFKRMILDCRAHYPLVMPFVLEKIALGIDQYHGYGTPHKTSEVHFKKARKEVSELLHGLPHACQEYGPSFSNVVSAQEIRDFKKTPVMDPLETASTDTPVRFTIRNPKKHYLDMRHHVSRPIQKRPEVLEKKRHSKTPSIRREKYSEKRSRSPSHEYIEKKRKTISRPKRSYGSTDIWSVYRDLISKAAIELESLYDSYRKQPEKHPHYDKEWNTFWRRRKEELMLEGKNYRSHNFQPEWTTYFRQRLEQMFGEDLQKSKLNVRHHLNIPINAEEDSFPTPQSQVSHKGSRSHSGNIWDKTFVSHYSEEPIKTVPDPKKIEKPTVIHMLRLMTALEDHLGSLGTKILDLLTKAVSLEKFYQADSPELEKRILTPNNYRLLKTATEKLKSKLYADLITGNIVNSFKRVIECSEIILKKAEIMGWANESELTIDNENTQIKNLIEVLQEKRNISPSINKKSLSDALMEVISQKKLIETQTSFNAPTAHAVVEKQKICYTNNVPSNYYSNMPTHSLPYFPQNTGSGPVNRNSVAVQGVGKTIHFNSQFGRNLFGITGMEWPNANTRYSYQAQNHNSNSGFMNTYPNAPNDDNWRS